MDLLATRRFERRMFLIAALLFPAVILVGFGPTYYVKAWFGTPPLPSTLVHVHGLLMTGWVILFITQVFLVSSQRLTLHRSLGYGGIALAAGIVLTGVPVALRAAKYGAASTPPGVVPLQFMAVPLFDLVVFVLLFAAAIYYRRRPAAHKSLMLLIAISLVPPAIARIRIDTLQALGPIWFFGVPTVLAATCVVLDARRRGRLNRVLLAGTILLVVSYVVRLALMPTAAWASFATWATSFV
jgi:hypothetical protein